MGATVQDHLSSTSHIVDPRAGYIKPNEKSDALAWTALYASSGPAWPGVAVMDATVRFGHWLRRNDSLIESGHRERFPMQPEWDPYQEKFVTPAYDPSRSVHGTDSKNTYHWGGGRSANDISPITHHSYPKGFKKYKYPYYSPGWGDAVNPDDNRPMDQYHLQNNYVNYLRHIFPPQRYPEGPPSWFLDKNFKDSGHLWNTPQYTDEKATPNQNFFYGQEYPEHLAGTDEHGNPKFPAWYFENQDDKGDGINRGEWKLMEGSEYTKDEYDINKAYYDSLVDFFPPFEGGGGSMEFQWEGIGSKRNLPIGIPTEYIFGPNNQDLAMFNSAYYSGDQFYENENAQWFLDGLLRTNQIDQDKYDSLMLNLNAQSNPTSSSLSNPLDNINLNDQVVDANADNINAAISSIDTTYDSDGLSRINPVPIDNANLASQEIDLTQGIDDFTAEVTGIEPFAFNDEIPLKPEFEPLNQAEWDETLNLDKYKETIAAGQTKKSNLLLQQAMSELQEDDIVAESKLENIYSKARARI